MPIIGLDFAAHGVHLLFGFNGATLVNTELSTDFRIAALVLHSAVQLAIRLAVRAAQQSQAVGPGHQHASYFPIGHARPRPRRRQLRAGPPRVGWSLEARWLPALDAAFDTYDLRAQVSFNVIGLSAFFRRSSHMGAVNNLMCGGLGIGVNFARF